MKSEKELLEMARHVDKNSAFYNNSFIIRDNGFLYPIKDGKLVNPLDPGLLIKCCSVNDVSILDMLIDTMVEVTAINSIGFEVVTRYKNNAPRVIKLKDESDKVIILGDLSSQKALYFPLLITQLNDNGWKQEDSEPWASLGFATPKKNAVIASHCSSVDSTYYSIGGSKLRNSIKTNSSGFVEYISFEWCNNCVCERPKFVWDDNTKDF